MEHIDDTFFDELLGEICINCADSFMIKTAFGDLICKKCGFTILDTEKSFSTEPHLH